MNQHRKKPAGGIIGKLLLGLIVILPMEVARANDSAPPRPQSADSAVRLGDDLDDQYEITRWTIKNGLPQNSVTDIVQTRDGYIWLATFGGLARFDGIHFDVFDLANTEGMVSNRITALCEDAHGVLWIGTENGRLTCYDRGRFTSFIPPDDIDPETIRKLATDRRDAVWLLADRGLFRFAGGAFERIINKNQSANWSPHDLLIDSNGRLLVAAHEGVWCQEKDHLVLGFPGSVTSIAEDAAENLWLAIDGNVNVVRDGTLSKLPIYLNRVVEVVYPSRSQPGRLWIRGGTWIGVFDTTEPHPAKAFDVAGPPLANVRIQPIIEDREGNVWVGTIGRGLFRLSPRRVRRFYFDDAGLLTGVNALAQDADGTILAAVGSRGVRRVVDGAFMPFPELEDFRGHGSVRALANDATGALWIEHDGTFSRRSNGAWTHFDGADDLHDDRIDVLYAARDGSLWAGSSALLRFKDDRFTQVPGSSGALGRIRSIFEAADGAIWFGGELGAACYRGSQVTRYSADDGLAPGEVRAFYEEDSGAIWFGTYGGGLCRLKSGRFVRITTQNGLFDNAVSSILADGNGNLWINSNHGVFAVSLHELNACADGDIPDVNCISVDSGEGNGPGGLRAADGRLWFPTIEGVAVVDPPTFVRNRMPPNVIIESVNADGRLMDALTDLTIPPGDRDLRIHYTGLGLMEPWKVRFRYRLDGHDRRWIEAGAARRAHYTNVPPGRFVFRVIACNNDGVWNQTGAGLHLHLLPHLYETRWFFIACLLATASVGFVGYRTRVRRIRRRNIELERQIADRKRAEHALRESEAHLRMLAENMHEVLWLTDWDEKKLLYVSPAYERIFRQSCERLYRDRMIWLERIHPDDRRRIAHIFRSNAEKGLPVDEEYRLRFDDGEIRWVRDQAIPITNDHGHVYRFMGIAEDITERKRTEHALRDVVEGTAGVVGAAFFQTLAQHMAEALGVRHAIVAEVPANAPPRARTLGVWANGAIGPNIEYELAGTPCENVLQSDLCFYPSSVQQRFPADDMLVEMEAESYMGVPLKDADGCAIGLLSVIDDRPMKDSSLSRLLLGIFSVRAAAELERARAERELRRTRALLEAAIEACPAGVVIAEAPDVTIRVANRAALDIQGGAPDTLVNIPYEVHPSRWQSYHPDGTPFEGKDLPLSRAILNGETSRNVDIIIKNQRRGDRWVLGNAAPVRDREGNIIAAVVVFPDVTDLKNAEKERQSLEAQLRHAQKLEAVGTFAAGIAHDVRNVLTAILAGIDLAEGCAQDESKLHATLADVRRAGQECADIVTSLTSFSRRDLAERSDIDLADVVRRAVPLLRHSLPDPVECVAKIQDHAFWINGNAAQINQVLLNLTLNARDAMPAGGRLTIGLTAQYQPDADPPGPGQPGCLLAVLTVEDTGVGMTGDVCDHAFEPFFTTKPRESGTGLGLAVVHGIVKDHGGDVIIDSGPGRGTKFSVRIPCSRAGRGQARQTPGTVPSPLGHGATLLLVEDNPPVRSMVTAALVSANYHVLQAADGDQALRIFDSGAASISAVITDWNLPNCGGAALLRSIWQKRSDLPAVIITGSDEHEFDNLLSDRNVAVLPKPFTIADLRTIVAQILGHPTA